MTVVATRAPAGVGLAPSRVIWTLRLVLLAVCLAAAAPLHQLPGTIPAVVLLLLVALPSLRLPAESRTIRGLRVLEALIAAVAVAATGLVLSPFPLYLTVPVVAAGLLAGVGDAAVVIAVGAAGLTTVGALNGDLVSAGYLTTSVEVVALCCVLASVATWTRRLFLLSRPEEQRLYDSAYRLLTQLRTVARRLPGTLDPVSVTGEMLGQLADVVPYQRAGVFVNAGGDRLTPLGGGAEALDDWEVSLSADSPFAEAWTSQDTQVAVRPGRPWLVVVPLQVGVRTTGLVGMEGVTSEPPTRAVLDQVRELTDAVALRLETALLFDDIRDLATAEERSRLAREIHDGIAQELVIVGYDIDNALAETDDEPSRQALHRVRGEITRIVSELRLSLFDLRSDIEPHGGLGAAISAYLQNTGSVTGLTVHIRLNESSHRLPALVETELLRIVGEAVANARKHSGAQNLWVSCDIDPPQALITIEDDGKGITGTGRRDSFGLSVMAERAERIRANLEVGPRENGGTRVAVGLAGADTTRTLARTNAQQGEPTSVGSGQERSAGR